MIWRLALPGIQSTLSEIDIAHIRKRFNAMPKAQQQAVLDMPIGDKEDWALGLLTELSEDPERTTWKEMVGDDFVPLGDRVHEAQRHTKHALGCFQAAGDDEPVFTLRAKDAFAPAVVAFWMTLVETSVQPGVDVTHLSEKLDDARHCIGAMVEWQRANTHKIPD